MWEFLKSVPLDPWWHNVVVYLGVGWVTTILCLRFGPRECPKLKTEMKNISYNQPLQEVVRHYTRKECVEASHWFHLGLREYAVLYAAFWPLWLIAAVPILVVLGLVNMTGALGQADWYTDKIEERQRLAELLEKTEAS